MPGSLIGGFATAAVNTVTNQMLQNNAFANNKSFWHETFDAQNRRQDFLNLYGASMQKQALRNAGLSTASMDGAPFSETVGTGTPGNSVAPGFSIDPLSFAQIENIKSQTVGQNIANNNAQRDADDRHALNNITVALQRAQEQYTRGKDERETAQNEKSLELMSNQISFADLQNKGKVTENDINLMHYKVMNETYEWNGKKVKGYQIDNFNTIFAYQLAKKANDIAQQNANINQQNANTNKQNADTNEAAQLKSVESIATRFLLLPMVKWIMDKLPDGDEIVAGLKTELQNLGVIDKDGKPVAVSPTGPTP